MLKSFGKAPDKSRLQHSPNFRGGKFHNPVPTKTATLSQVPQILGKFIRRDVEKAPVGDYVFEETNVHQVNGELAVNWLGHAALLIRVNDKTILTDPMLSHRASPLSFVGPQRFGPSPIAASDLPAIDIVLISHDHYDHLDRATIEVIKDKVKHFIVPLGLKETMLHWEVPADKLTEMDWWQEVEIDDVKIMAAPVRHFSGRLFDRNNTLWNSYTIHAGTHRLYFAGDSGFFEGFSEVAKYGPFDLSFLPIGAYFEAWQDIHMDPEEAVRVWEILGGGAVLPIHWGTFDLGLHAWYEPIQRLTAHAGEKNIPLITPQPGEWIAPLTHNSNWDWWRAFSKEADMK